MAAEKEKIVRSRTVSFRDIHIAKVTTNTETEYTAETPSKLARAITGKISDEFETEKIYSDDSVEDVNMSYKGTSVELEVNSLAPQDKSQVFGHLYEKGFLIKTKDDKAPELALGWRAKKLNGKYEFKWLYCGRFGQGFEDNYETEGETKTTQTATLKGDFYARQMDGRYECSVDESNLLAEHTEAATAIKDWFSKVQEKPDVASNRREKKWQQLKQRKDQLSSATKNIRCRRRCPRWHICAIWKCATALWTQKRNGRCTQDSSSWI